MNEKELRKEIRKLRNLKLKMRGGTPERVKLHRKIGQLQEQIERLKTIDIEKLPLIEGILRIDNSFTKLGINLNKFTVKQLEYHLYKIKAKAEKI